MLQLRLGVSRLSISILQERAKSRSTQDSGFHEMCFTLYDPYSMNHLLRLSTNNDLKRKIRTIWLLDAPLKSMKPSLDYWRRIEPPEEYAARLRSNGPSGRMVFPARIRKVERNYEILKARMREWSEDELVLKGRRQTYLKYKLTEILMNFHNAGDGPDIRNIRLEESRSKAWGGRHIMNNSYLPVFKPFGANRWVRLLDRDDVFAEGAGKVGTVDLVLDAVGTTHLDMKQLDLGGFPRLAWDGFRWDSRSYPQKLRRLRLAFDRKCFVNSSSRAKHSFRALVRFLSAASGLEHLYLDLTGLWRDGGRYEHHGQPFHCLATRIYPYIGKIQSVDVAPYQDYLPRLKSLELLQDLGGYDETLVDFVRERKKTLRTIRVLRDRWKGTHWDWTWSQVKLKRCIEDALDITSDEQRPGMEVTVVDGITGPVKYDSSSLDGSLSAGSLFED
jgi:hypothetical protein